MNNEQSLDASLVEQTKHQIRAMVAEIAQLAKSDIAPEDFHTEFLPRVVSALAAVGGALWTVDTKGALSLAYQVNMKESRIHESETANRKHSRLLYQQMEGPDDGTLVPPHSGGEGPDEPGNPTDYLLVFCPIRTELEVVGVLEILQRPDTGPIAQKGYTRFISQMGAYATDYYKNRQLRNFNDRQALWSLLEEFTRNIHKSLDLRETAYTIVNEGRRLIECDRVSIAIRRGTNCRIEAVSGQDMFDKRATHVKMLGKLANSVIKSNEEVWYTGDTTDFAPQVEKAVEDYVDESHTKMIAVFPLSKILLEEKIEEEASKNPKPEPPFGALIVEQIEDSRIPERMRKRVEIVSEHACSALGNSLDHNSVFLMPVWRAIGKSKVLLSARMLPKTITVTLAIIAVLCFLILMPADFEMISDGTLQPKDRQKVYAAISGTVQDVYVKHRSVVHGPRPTENPLVVVAGSPLIQLSSTEMERKFQETQGQIDKLLKEKSVINEQLIKESRVGSASREHENLRAQIEVINVQLDTLDKSLRLLNVQAENLLVTSPMDGVVMTWQPEENLRGRTVGPGDELMEVADPSGDYFLELAMPEKYIGHITTYRNENPGTPQRVRFTLASDPKMEFTGTVELIDRNAAVRGEAGAAGGGSTVLIRVNIDDQSKIPSIHPGTSCKAKVFCGRRSFGYTKLHDAIAFFYGVKFKYW